MKLGAMETMRTRGLKNRSSIDAGILSFNSKKSYPSSLVSYDSDLCRGGLRATIRLIPRQATCLSQPSTIDQSAEMPPARGTNIREFMTGWMDESPHISKPDLADLAPVG